MSSRCIFHDNEPAVARCKLCLKPLCASCEVKAPEGSFCGDSCIEKYRRAMTHLSESQKKEEEFREKDQADRQKQFMIRFIAFVTLAVAAAVAWFFLPADIQNNVISQIRHFLH